MKSLRKLSQLLKRENGDAIVEYALLIAFISIALVAGATALTGGVSGIFSKIGSTLSSITITT